MDYHSAIKRNEFSDQGKTWRNLKYKSLSERSLSKEATWCMVPAIWHFGKGKNTERVKRSVVTSSSGEGER